MSRRTIRLGDTLFLHPSDKRVIQWDWDALGLEAGVLIAGSVWTITPVKQSVEAAALTKSDESILAGNRKTQLKLLATTASVGDLYTVLNVITTNETPAQEIGAETPVVISTEQPR